MNRNLLVIITSFALLAYSLAANLRSDYQSSSAHNAETPSLHIKMESAISDSLNRYTRGLRVPSSQHHTVVFAIHKLHMDELRTKLDDISNPFSANYGNHMTREQVNAFVTNEIGSNTLLHYLENYSEGEDKIDIVDKTPRLDYITAKAPVYLWERFLNTEFHFFHPIESARKEEG